MVSEVNCVNFVCSLRRLANIFFGFNISVERTRDEIDGDDEEQF
jgi:hypothetical protein